MSGAGFPEDTSALDAWASGRVKGYAGPSVARKFPTGQSNPTYLVDDARAARYVLRRKPPGKLLKSAHMVEREYRVLRALEGSGFPAPRALALCEDESVVGSVFYLMSHVDGRIFWDPGDAGIDARGARRRLRRDERSAGAAARDRRRRGGPLRLRQARQLFRAADAALERAISRQRNRARSPTWTG